MTTYTLPDTEAVVIDIPCYQADGSVYRNILAVRRRIQTPNEGPVTIDYWLREYNAAGLETYNLPVSTMDDAIGRAFERASFGWYGPTPDEVTYTMDEIVARVMNNSRGCDEGKRDFLREQFDWNPMSQYAGTEFTVTIVQTYELGAVFEGEVDDLCYSVQCAVRDQNIQDHVQGLDRTDQTITVDYR